MLTYLINVTEDLMAVFLVIGTAFAFTDCFTGEKGRKILRIGFLIGLAAAGIRTYITNTRRLVGGWRVGAWGFGISLVLFLLLFAALIVLKRKVAGRDIQEEKTSLPELILSLLTALLVISYLYCDLPNVLIYPFKFDTGGNGLLSTDFLFRLGGYLLGIIVCVLAAVGAYKLGVLTAVKKKQGWLYLAFAALILLRAVNLFARLMLVLTPRKIIDSMTLFTFAAASNNNSEWYAYAGFFILLALGAACWVRSYTFREPYANKAQHRKQRALWRSGKRYTVLLAVCFAVTVLCATWFVKLNTVEIREAPVEEPILMQNDQGEDILKVPLEMVMDGHLHRFGYTTEDGYPTRFIVILKQENTNNYGIGMDACEICGEAGYYENNEGKVVCKKCGVVMNTSTIGMKGGCNPIIIDYDIDEDCITVPVSELVRNQSRFKK